MQNLRTALQAHGYEVMDVGYPSTRRTLAEHADQVNTLLDSVAKSGEIRTISFVTHSLGGILARASLAAAGVDLTGSAIANDELNSDSNREWRRSIQVNRLAMLAPPSNGSAFAESLKDFLPFQWFAGDAGQQVTLTEARNLPLPDCLFGVIAGHRGVGKGWNPLLRGEDDGILRVEETRLPGAEDFWVVEGTHTFLMDDELVIEGVLNYLQCGRFRPRS
jgi:hypothetical protein